MKTTQFIKFCLPIAAVAFSVLSAPAMAAKFPSKPVELICTTSPGSGAGGMVQLPYGGKAFAAKRVPWCSR